MFQIFQNVFSELLFLNLYAYRKEIVLNFNKQFLIFLSFCNEFGYFFDIGDIRNAANGHNNLGTERYRDGYDSF